MSSAAKVFLTLLHNPKVRKIIISFVFGILILILFIVYSTTQQSSSALAEAASAEYSFWQSTSPSQAGYSCQGEKYCSHFNTEITDWCCYFVGVCADNADIDPEEIGFSPSTNTWKSNLSDVDKLMSAGSYVPKRGNLVFFNYDGRNNYESTGFVAHVGIVTETSDNTITVIAGNEYNGATENWATVSYVNKYTLNINDDSIACYGAVGTENIVSATGLNQVTRDVICHNEIGEFFSDIDAEKYGSVIANDNGALSIGVYGWHGNKALSLIQKASQINNVQVTAIVMSYPEGETVLSAIQNGFNWSSYIPTENVCDCIKAILLTDAGKQAQGEQSLQDAQTYIDICKDNGLTDPKSVVYCSDILNQWGTSSFNANVYGSGNHGVLYGVNNSMSLFDIYNSQRGWQDSNYNYESRRNWTYEYLKDIPISKLIEIPTE